MQVGTVNAALAFEGLSVQLHLSQVS